MIRLHHLLISAFLIAPLLLWAASGGALAQSTPTDCLPPATETAEIYAVNNGTYSVRGPLAGFDPCNPSVIFRKPKNVEVPPLIIFVHGGGGGSDNDGAIQAFSAEGVAILGFDAYRMNGFDRPSRFWALQVTYEARQRMIYTTARAAYLWASKRSDIAPGRIFLYGLSNGADVVANIAAEADPAHVRMIFAEGLAGAGLGLPDTLTVPLRAIFGRLDNFGSISATEWRWIRTNPCLLNHPTFPHPPGNSANCNMYQNPGQRTEAPIEWIKRQKTAGAEIDTWFYDGAAHGAFIGPLRIRTNTWGNGVVAQASVGAEPAARDKLLNDVLEVVRKP